MTPTPPTSAGGAGTGPPPIPDNGAYLGAWVNPATILGTGTTRELSQLAAFTQATSSRPAILGVYTGFAAPPPISALEAIYATGAVPLIAWGCGSVTAISSGRYDGRIRSYATALKTLHRPVLLRWFWEMNLPDETSTSCLGTAGAPGFIRAWDHIWTEFHAVGADNVAFVWCPGVGTRAGWTSFFPGTNYVDWIGADGYDQRHLGTAGFTSVFGEWYSEYAPAGKPMIVAETGATPVDQTAYIEGMAQSLPLRYRDVKAVVYFDSAGHHGPWTLTPTGLSAYKSMASTQYFSYHANTSS